MNKITFLFIVFNILLCVFLYLSSFSMLAVTFSTIKIVTCTYNPFKIPKMSLVSSTEYSSFITLGDLVVFLSLGVFVVSQRQ